MTSLCLAAGACAGAEEPDAGKTATPSATAEPADPVAPSSTPRFARLRETDLAVSDGFLLVTYADLVDGEATAWRLYDRRDRAVAVGFDASTVDGVGDGFVLSTRTGLRFVDPPRQVTRIDRQESARPLAAGDVFVPSVRGVYRPETAELFRGAADPDGTVTHGDDRGRMWAVGRAAGDRTVVRWARPGERWTSRELGPAIGARTVQGLGSTLVVAGPRDLYLSSDYGSSWERVTHGVSQDTGPPRFEFRPDGTVIGGDVQDGYRISEDGGRSFRPASADEAEQPDLGALYSRGPAGATEISADGRSWVPFSLATARRLLADLGAD